MKISKNFKKKILHYIEEKGENFIMLDSCNYKNDSYTDFECIIAFGEEDKVENLEEFYRFNKKKDWKFGYFSYDLKNGIDLSLTSENKDYLKFSELYFFIPKNIFIIKKETLEVKKTDIDNVSKFVNKIEATKIIRYKNKVKINNRLSKKEYLDKVKKIKDYIQKGDIYEVNFTQEFYAKKAILNAVEIFFKLREKSKAPFSSIMKIEKNYIISSSPERYIKRIGDKLISQPIKGTSKKGINFLQDIYLKRKLQRSKKDIAENTMIVDLVRNDLGKIAEKGNVSVEEYCKVYSFKSVNQLVSTIICQLKKGISFKEILEATFPMGSMTGAPKYSAMKIIEEQEETKRGVYSGALGYITPKGDFDFSVLIRTILYNSENKYLSFITGGAITDKSNPEEEYEECNIKAKSIVESLEDNNILN